ncbi:MAG: sarcosine oxidase subunit gamma [Rhodobacter sp.]|uniref:sarcosine oxidase subunit gamma n=1 Tax=Pararhodobacter sp. TaxID=2127056 RepID=UPI001DF20591|nr:sarcosine oxidase subunit gamma family protein [Pararhodobacter sp.]MCB1346429.1 sarcosine oxidase subunit gamma [Paracoccaceae bacterium]MCC0072032.1 sarcosine oxidase subunit gamma [Rhodobacter sp.]HPD94065.1 sarcosine oxidase subunit gamma family protein [Pararhodobacter sp.]
MSDAVSALAGAHSTGMVDLADAGLQGMITLRGDLSSGALADAVRAATGAEVPARRRVATGDRGQALWMSPDELLLVVPYAQAATTVAALETALAGEFATAANVSDARAMVTIKGIEARNVLAKLCPVDFRDFAVGDLRRTRAAQVAAAIWREDENDWRLVCFRSVAGYVWGALATVAQPGGEVGLYR